MKMKSILLFVCFLCTNQKISPSDSVEVRVTRSATARGKQRALVSIALAILKYSDPSLVRVWNRLENNKTLQAWHDYHLIHVVAMPSFPRKEAVNFCFKMNRWLALGREQDEQELAELLGLEEGTKMSIHALQARLTDLGTVR